MALSTAEEAADATEEAAEAAADVADATAEPAADVASGISMGTPASWHVFSTAAMVAAWSSALQAPCTQGWTVPRSFAPCLQWHAKSVRLAQPSEVRAGMKQDN